MNPFEEHMTMTVTVSCKHCAWSGTYASMTEASAKDAARDFGIHLFAKHPEHAKSILAEHGQ